MPYYFFWCEQAGRFKIRLENLNRHGALPAWNPMCVHEHRHHIYPVPLNDQKFLYSSLGHIQAMLQTSFKSVMTVIKQSESDPEPRPQTKVNQYISGWFPRTTPFLQNLCTCFWIMFFKNAYQCETNSIQKPIRTKSYMWIYVPESMITLWAVPKLKFSNWIEPLWCWCTHDGSFCTCLFEGI